MNQETGRTTYIVLCGSESGTTTAISTVPASSIGGGRFIDTLRVATVGLLAGIGMGVAITSAVHARRTLFIR